MGNLLSGASAAVGASSGGGGGKVVMADGSVRALSEPVSVAEIMMDHPRHFVVDARDLKEHKQHHNKGGGNGGGGPNKVAPLPADHVLAAGGVYVLLPATRGGKVSAEEARRALTAARSLARSRSVPGSGGLRRKLSTSASSRKGRGGADAADIAVQHVVPAAPVGVAEEDEEEAGRPDGFEELRPEFLSRELSSRGWKPSLRTIEERAAPKKVPHWLF